jgi:UDP-N-acetylglucosamine transferase subunit ALG13
MTPFFQPDELDALIDKARLVIAHGGTGSILPAVKKGKKVIAVARYAELNENSDNHQVEILNALSKSNYIIPWYKESNLHDLIKQSENFIPSNYNSTKHFILNYLSNYILKS